MNVGPNKPKREIDLDQPGSEVSKLYVKLPSSRVAKTAMDAIVMEDNGKRVEKWFPESYIAGYSVDESIKKDK